MARPEPTTVDDVARQLATDFCLMAEAIGRPHSVPVLGRDAPRWLDRMWRGAQLIVDIPRGTFRALRDISSFVPRSKLAEVYASCTGVTVAAARGAIEMTSEALIRLLDPLGEVSGSRRLAVPEN